MKKNLIKKNSGRRPKLFNFFKNLILFCASILFIILGAGAIWFSNLEIPDFNSFNKRKIINSTKIYDRTGKILLYDINRDIKRTNISSDNMSLHIKNATVAIEDSEFYQHKGVRFKAIARAFLSNLLWGKNIQGGSTITQQLIKNTLLTQKKTLTRKTKEWILAIKMEQVLTKEKILEYYLNESPYGSNIYGIEEAAKFYFNKAAQDLTLGESAYLAALPKAPTFYSPYGKNKDKLEERKNFILNRMLALGFVKQEEYDKAKIEKVIFHTKEERGIKAPHFVFFIKEYLEGKYGDEKVEVDGLRVTTTLDYSLQEKAEKIVLEGALENEKEWNGSNAGIVAIDPKTGQILTMVGSRDYFDKNIDGKYNIATANRQPGSAFKPFIYATAFKNGFMPETVLFDLRTEFQTTCDAFGKALPGRNQEDCYRPRNYDNKYKGPVTLRAALAQSRNVPSVKLFYLAGMKDSLKTAEEMGISTLKNAGYYGLTLVIGGGEVSLLDMTSAYGVFANGGIRNNYTGILKVEDKNGKILEEFSLNPKEVLEKNVALTISDVLSDNKSRVPTFGLHSNLYIPKRKVAAKTGTTNNNKDAWLVGYTPSIAVGVWAGNNNNIPMKKGGVSVAGPIWNKFMTEALKDLPMEKFEKPDLQPNSYQKPILKGHWEGNESFWIDKISGKLATELTPEETKVEKVITNVHSILYWIDRKNLNAPQPIDPTNDPQFINWETPIQKWWAENFTKYKIITVNDKPTLTDDVHVETSRPIISIIDPSPEAIFNPNQEVNIKINSTGRFPLKKIDIFVNNNFLGSATAPFSFSFIPINEVADLKEQNEIKIIAQDSVYNTSETISFFRILNQGQEEQNQEQNQEQQNSLEFNINNYKINN